MFNTSINSESKMYQIIQHLQSYLWAYSKLATQKDRENYSAELQMQKVSDLSKSQQPYIGDVHLVKDHKEKIAIIEKNERERTLLMISEIGTLQNKSFIVEDEIKQYEVTEIKDAKKKVRIVYSENIDFRRIEEDKVYNEAVKKTVSTDSVKRAYKYLGGYIGELRTKKSNQGREIIEPEYNETYTAMCQKFQREQRKLKERTLSKKRNGSVQDTPSGNGDER